MKKKKISNQIKAKAQQILHVALGRLFFVYIERIWKRTISSVNDEKIKEKQKLSTNQSNHLLDN